MQGLRSRPAGARCQFHQVFDMSPVDEQELPTLLIPSGVDQQLLLPALRCGSATAPSGLQGLLSRRAYEVIDLSEIIPGWGTSGQQVVAGRV